MKSIQKTEQAGGLHSRIFFHSNSEESQLLIPYFTVEVHVHLEVFTLFFFFFFTHITSFIISSDSIFMKSDLPLSMLTEGLLVLATEFIIVPNSLFHNLVTRHPDLQRHILSFSFSLNKILSKTPRMSKEFCSVFHSLGYNLFKTLLSNQHICRTIFFSCFCSN